MKKILLSLMLIGSFAFVKAQEAVLFNEFYLEHATGESEFVELYNTSAFSKNLDCYTLVSYYQNSTSDKGFYVLNFPSNAVIPSKKWLVGSTHQPLMYQNGTYTPVQTYDFAWDNLGTSGYLKKYALNEDGTGYIITDVPAGELYNIFKARTGAGASYSLFLFNETGALANALFVGVGNVFSIPSFIRSMPNLTTQDIAGDDCVARTFDFKLTGPIRDDNAEYTTSGIGNSNGVRRIQDGRCGTWDKSSSGNSHNPGVSNTGTVGTDVSRVDLAAGIVGGCPTTNSSSFVYQYRNTNFPEGVSSIDLFVYIDKNNNGILDTDDGEAVASEENITTTTVTPFSTTIEPPYNHNIIFLVAVTPEGCFDNSLETPACILLPVHFKSFNATRLNASNVSIAWTTASEQNNRGFNVQKNVNGEWKTIAFVFSQAPNGNSTSDLSYSYNDPNMEKGISQYRVQQVDLDGKFTYSEIRAIRGEGSVGKIVIYPNPSTDGKISVVFEDNSAVRDVIVNDMQGRIVQSFKGITNNILVIDRLASGFYTIKVTNRTTAASSVQKVVIK